MCVCVCVLHRVSQRQHDLRVSKILGKGFKSRDRARRDVKSWRDMIETKYPADFRKQMQLVDGLKRHFSLRKDQDVVALAVFQSIKDWVSALHMKYPGRFPNHARKAYLAVAQASGMPSSKEIRQHVSIERRASAIGIDVVVMYKQRTIFNKWFKDVSNSLVVLRGKVRSDRYPDEWYEFTRAVWLDRLVSRGSEKTRDELKDPTEWSSGKTFRKHFLEENLTRSIEKIKLLAQVIYAPVLHAY